MINYHPAVISLLLITFSAKISVDHVVLLASGFSGHIPKSTISLRPNFAPVMRTYGALKHEVNYSPPPIKSTNTDHSFVNYHFNFDFCLVCFSSVHYVAGSDLVFKCASRVIQGSTDTHIPFPTSVILVSSAPSHKFDHGKFERKLMKIECRKSEHSQTSLNWLVR